MITFKVKDWFDYLPKEFNIKIYPGYTPLIGRNGSGKTTLLYQIEEFVKKRSDEYELIRYSNLIDGGRAAMDKYLNVTEDMTKLATVACSSEGQRMMINVGDTFTMIGRAIRTNTDKKLVVLFDALDSGTSIDNIREFTNVFNIIVEDAKKFNKEVYIISACNSYEMVKNVDAIYVRTGKHMMFTNYEAYAKFICSNE